MEKGKALQQEKQLVYQQKKKIIYFLIKYFNWIILAFILIVFVLGYFLFIQPKYKQITQELDIISASEEKDYAERQEHLAQLIKLKDAYYSIERDDINKINTFLPDYHGAEDILSQLEFIVLRNGLLLKSLQIKKDKEEVLSEKDTKVRKIAAREEKKSISSTDSGLEVGEIEIGMEVVGVDYIALKNLLKTIENNLRLYDISSINYSPEGGALIITLSTYYLE